MDDDVPRASTRLIGHGHCWIERFAAFEHAETQHQQLAHRGHRNLFALKAPLSLKPGS